MLVGNLSDSSLTEALERTFDGKHPCSLCRAIAEGKKTERNSDRLVLLKKFEGLNQSAGILLPAAPSFARIEAANAGFETRPLAPPTPPPRAV